MFLQVLLLMATALNLPINEASAPIELRGDLTTDVRIRQQRIAEITEMIHVSLSENFIVVSVFHKLALILTVSLLEMQNF